jgi:hypothetical protein
VVANTGEGEKKADNATNTNGKTYDGRALIALTGLASQKDQGGGGGGFLCHETTEAGPFEGIIKGVGLCTSPGMNTGS